MPVRSVAALGTLLAGLVVLGLLHFPATCRCGADLPHTHSLFQLAGHHHDHRAHAHAPHAHNQSTPAMQAAAEHAIEGPALTTPGQSEVETRALIATTQSTAHARGRRLRRRPARCDAARGRVVTPEIEPPRTLG